MPDFPESVSRIASCIEVGTPGNILTLSQPIKITFANERANTPYYGIELNSQRILITDRCDAIDTPTVDGIEISNSGSVGECYIQDGNDMTIWTSHFTSFGTISSASRSSSSSGGGGGGTISSLMAANLVMFNSCSDDYDGIVRILSFNQQGLDLFAKLYAKDFITTAVNVSEDVSYLKYIDRSSNDYEYSVFDARFPNHLDSFYVRLFDTDNSAKTISHHIKIPSNSCSGYVEPFELKDSKASILKPIEPLEIPVIDNNDEIDSLSPDSNSLLAMDPEPTAPAMDPEPTAPAMDPEPTAPAMDPEPTAPAMDPEPTAPAMDPEPTESSIQEYKITSNGNSNSLNSKCGPGTKQVNGFCEIIRDSSDELNTKTGLKKTNSFEQFLKWLGLMA